MSWSLAFNGKRSIISDSYQRVAISVLITEITGKDFINAVKELVRSNILHINVLVPPDYSKTIAANFIVERIQSLQLLDREINEMFGSSENKEAQTARTLFISIQLRNDMFPLAKALLGANFDADLWILDVSGQKNVCLKNVIEMHRLVEESGKNVKLGISTLLGPMELDWFLSKIPSGLITVVHLGEVLLPCLCIHSIELIHTAGYNAMVALTMGGLERDIFPSSLLNELATKYTITPDIFLAKCLLQLGCVVTLPYGIYNPAQPERVASVGRLGHPFVHRRPFVSVHKVVSLSIRPEDLQCLIDASEREEARADHFWMPHVKERSLDRILTYQN